jgi:hypothetical protein
MAGVPTTLTTQGYKRGMTAPAQPPYRTAGYWSPLRLLAVVATIATLVIGFVIAFGNLSAGSLKDWIAAGIISAGVALGCLILV